MGRSARYARRSNAAKRQDSRGPGRTAAVEFTSSPPRAGGGVGLEIAQRVLDAGQDVLHHRGIREDAGTVRQPVVEHAAFAFVADPAQGEVLVLRAHRQHGVLRLPGLLHIDAEQHVQVVAQGGLLQLVHFVGDLKARSL